MTYTQEVELAYAKISEGLKLIHITFQAICEQQEIINKAAKELIEGMITPENIIGGKND